ncbi:hypothetical protein BDV19DRAFT_366417 [Aspergillus venezuelensis]
MRPFWFRNLVCTVELVVSCGTPDQTPRLSPVGWGVGSGSFKIQILGICLAGRWDVGRLPAVFLVRVRFETTAFMVEGRFGGECGGIGRVLHGIGESKAIQAFVACSTRCLCLGQRECPADTLKR